MTPPVPDVPSPLLRADLAAPPRTLVDVFEAVVAEAADAMAIDSGVHTLTYAELDTAARQLAARLAEHGIGRGAKVGVRVRSGTTDLYTAILGVLVAGAAYVPVDADDPDERARVVFGEADVAAVIGNDLAIAPRHGAPTGIPGEEPTPEDDAWVIFTSGSTGTPKGVAVNHRNAAAFVDAESRLFLQAHGTTSHPDAGEPPVEPLGPGDRVMAGLSVAFDASCEEMWLAWSSGACLVPAPRSLVRAGVDVGPWLLANDITVVSTVPTLVALWPPASLERVRLLILGGEACPPELAARLQAPGREVWNTYGPTEATVVACAAMLDGTEPVRIGLPLDGWDLAVVDEQGCPVAEGASGQLIIGGVGLARYLDAAKDIEMYAPMPTLGWTRAYRSGDIVVNDPVGLLFGGRADDQVKLGGRRVELGEIDGQLLRLPGVKGAAAAVRRTASGNQLLVGYLAVDERYDPDSALALLRERMPAALVPRLAVVDDLPTRTSGKIDRDALPWPLPRVGQGPVDGLTPLQAWIAEIWADVLGADVTSPADDFFAFGGGSLTAAQIVGRLRERYPEVAVGDLYAHPRVGALAGMLEELGTGPVRLDRTVRPIRPKTQVGQLLALLPLRTLAAGRWIAWAMLVAALAAELLDAAWAPDVPWSVALLTAVLFLVPPVRMGLAALLVRIVLRGVRPGSYPRGGKVHLRLWLAGRIQDELAAFSTAGAPWLQRYARALGADIAPGVDLHALPPVTGLLSLGAEASVEPEVDLGGTWIDGDRIHVGRIFVGAGARVGARSMLGPGARVGPGAEIAPGSLVLGTVPARQFWSGSPAERVATRARGAWTADRPPRGRRWWLGYAVSSLVVAALPVLAVVAGALVVLRLGLAWLPLASLLGYAVLGLLVLLTVRLCSLLIVPGHHPTRSARGLAVWTTVRVLDEARTWLFPLYAGALTPVWLRLLGARVGRGVEASTVLLVPKLAQLNDHAFLADDTLIGCYELNRGWMRVERVKVGKRAFVGNSGMVSAGRKVPRESLVAVLSAAPRRKKVKAGSSWLGSPPTRLRRAAGEADVSRTYDPPTRLKVARGLIETLRVVPLLLHVLLHLGVAMVLLALLRWHVIAAFALGGVVMIVAGVGAALVTWAAKWAIVGRHTTRDHALWSAFVWRNELADTFTEVLAAPWFASVTQGTVVLNLWLRMLGARIGRGVWCDTYWLPETDLVDLRDGATVNHGCVVQTHLFHDRVLSMDTVTLQAGATLGPNSVILPAATLGRHSTVGPVSLVMRGELVPAQTRWIGNPIGPWDDAPEDGTTDGEVAR